MYRFMDYQTMEQRHAKFTYVNSLSNAELADYILDEASIEMMYNDDIALVVAINRLREPPAVIVKKETTERTALQLYVDCIGAAGTGWKDTSRRCITCLSHMDYIYCEEQLYLIRCPKCGTITMVKARAPADAAELAGGFE